MKNNKTFILVEAGLAVLVIMLVVSMIWGDQKSDGIRISVIVQNPDASEWTAFKYGLRMAAEDQNIEVFVASTGERLTLEEERLAIEHEIGKGVDGVIVQPAPGKDTEKMLEEIEKKIPVMLVDYTTPQTGGESFLPVTGPDQYQLGEALADEVLRDHSGNLKGMTIGLFSNTTDLRVTEDREKGVRRKIEEAGGNIHWFVAGDFEEAEDTFLRSQPETDIILALDDGSLTRIGQYAESEELRAQIYGIGNSTDAVYYLDVGIVECLLVPDQFDIGYQSMTEITGSIRRGSDEMKSPSVSYKMIRQDTLFSEENQDILFTMSQ